MPLQLSGTDPKTVGVELLRTRENYITHHKDTEVGRTRGVADRGTKKGENLINNDSVDSIGA